MAEEWMPYAQRCRAAGQDLLRKAAATSQKGTDPEFVAALVLIRTLSNFDGVLALARLRMVVEARVLTRCCHENLFIAFALKEQGESFVRRMKEDHEASRKARGESLLRYTETEDPELQAVLRELKSQTRALNPQNVAAGGPAEKASLHSSIRPRL